MTRFGCLRRGSDLVYYFLFQYLISVRDETIPSQVQVGKQGPQRLNVLSKETTGVKRQVDARFMINLLLFQIWKHLVLLSPLTIK